MRVLDLFCGMGGLSLGFRDEGFDVSGIDRDPYAVATYAAMVGPATNADLATYVPDGEPMCIVGGPPCRPWSVINVQRRGAEHADYALIEAFGSIVLAKLPTLFVLENVPLLRGDNTYRKLTAGLELAYDIGDRIVSYADWGAASRRRRLFLIGVRNDVGHSASEVFATLDGLHRDPMTARDAIGTFARSEHGMIPDHDWPAYRTIDRYADKYATNRYGWYQLKWDEPAPSFGNVSKTYTLHPDARNGRGPRVVSPREVIALLGFDETFRFPEGVPRGAKYRMAADAVSPRFSRALAAAIKAVVPLSQ